jgi:hypothetical protein
VLLAFPHQARKRILLRGQGLKKATLLFDEYKQRMGHNTNPVMQYNLEQLVKPREGLEHLSRPFTTEDIDTIIKQMPADKALGSDGFNGHFIKSCWDIIKEDFYTLCFDFFNGSLDLETINCSFITLIPKVNNPDGRGRTGEPCVRRAKDEKRRGCLRDTEEDRGCAVEYWRHRE